jgi:hypothetical protein
MEMSRMVDLGERQPDKTTVGPLEDRREKTDTLHLEAVEEAVGLATVLEAAFRRVNGGEEMFHQAVVEATAEAEAEDGVIKSPVAC